MHIAIDARELRTSTGRYVERLIHYLQTVDTQNTYTILLQPKDMASWEPTNPKFTKVACPYKEFSFAEQLGFCKQLYSLNADIVHFGMTQQPLLYFKKSITTVHDLTTVRFKNPATNSVVFRIKQQVYKVVILYAAHKSQFVLTPSQFVAEDLVRFAKIKPAKIIVTHESADKTTTPPLPLPYLQNKDFIMYVGRPAPHKNLPRLIEAFESLQKTDPELHLVLAGKTDANFDRIKADHGANKNIIFTGFVSDEELRWLYENTLAYVFPSLSEGFGLPGLEAMAYGAPVVSSNATCLPEIYGAAAVYFDPLDVPAMTNAITKVIDGKELRLRLRQAGYNQLKNFSWTKMAKQTLAVYERVKL